MKGLKIILLCLLLLPFANVRTQQERTTYYAIGFWTAAHSKMITYATITFFQGRVVSAQIISKDQFIYSALGHWPSPANPERIDLFAQHGVDNVFLLKNHICPQADSCARDSNCVDFFCPDSNPCKVSAYYAYPFEELWKIRFYEHPYDFDRPGWSQGQYWPSIYQKEFLRREYGLNNISTDYIYGDSLFKLLRDVQDPSWIVSYRTASSDTSGINNTVETDSTASP